ncbi:LPS assembly protein LptD [Sulfitobacter sp. BDSS02]|nr:LPS assembly protein LptD [Sulfitobacter sp. BDSS02]
MSLPYLRAALLSFALVSSAAVPAVQAQQTAARPPAVLVADDVYVTPDRTLVAEGNVEAFQDDIRMRAKRITFDQDSETLTVEGPIRIDQGGEITVFADFAELDRGLQNGLLTGARMVLNQQVQMASLQMARVNGRYTQLYKTAVTSCEVCGDGRPPLWQIRARKITHDQQEQQLYFEEAQFLVYDVPIFYLPGMRLPDPSLERANGFLIPSVRTTSTLGTGVRVPYFFMLGDHADLTLAPYVSSSTRTLGYRYRQAFRNGRIELEGAYTKDDLIVGTSRGYLFGNGHFDLPRGYDLDFQIQTTSDNAYLVDYGLPDLDRLQSEISVSRYKVRSAFRARLINYDSLRDTDDESLLPTIVLKAGLERRFFPDAIGGELRIGFDVTGLHRTSNDDVFGRDMNRATVDMSWQRSWILRGGVRADWEIGLAGDAYEVIQDSTFDNRIDRVTPHSALKLSLPMTRGTANGGNQFLEPLVQIGWSNVIGPTVPNEESTYAEFDQGNLLELSRFPGLDRREDGLAIAYGFNWSNYARGGWETYATFGQVIREEAQPDFTQSSGLTGTSSDLLLAGQLKMGNKLAVSARTLLNESFGVTKAELRGDWLGETAQLSGTYLWLDEDAQENRTDALSEVWLSGGYEIGTGWTANANLRYDISDARATRAGLGFVYRNECVTVDLAVNRRYTSSTSIEPTTDFGFTIELNGFSVQGEKEKYRRSCS